jgi:hypothetical protein
MGGRPDQNGGVRWLSVRRRLSLLPLARGEDCLPRRSKAKAGGEGWEFRNEAPANPHPPPLPEKGRPVQRVPSHQLAIR